MKFIQTVKIIVRRIRSYFTFKRVFYAGLILKGVDGAVELFTAIALFFVHPGQIYELVVFATRGELLEDPHDFIANLLLRSTSHISHDTTVFLIVYLLIHATVKLVAVFGIILKQLWAYPFALVTLGLLTLYQFYAIAIQPSVGIILLTVLDVFVLWLIAREYRRIRAGQDPNMVSA